jgi:hypothetical protein
MDGDGAAAPVRGLRARRSRLVVVVACVVLVATACDRWAGVGYGPARTGYNAAESELGVGEVGGLTESWTAAVPAGASRDQPVIAEDRVLLAADEVRAFDLAGTEGCAGSPTVCEPLWRSTPVGARWVTVADGVAYAAGDGWLHAFDAAGVDGCAGTPTVCGPLWRASIGSGGSSPAVTHGRVYVTGDVLYAFDALGVEGCAGAPTTCEPIWGSSLGGRGGAAVSGGVAYVVTTTDGVLAAYDAFGEQGCAGSPRTCTPVRTYELDPDGWCFPYGCGLRGPPTVAEGGLYVLGTRCCSGGMGAVDLHAFDAAGAVGCAGSPVVCEATASRAVPSDALAYAQPPVAVANGVAYVSALVTTAVDASTLQTLWTAPGGVSSASVADGVVHRLGAGTVGSGFGVRLESLDAAGSVGCAGAPVVCQPLFTSDLAGELDVFALLQAAGSGPAVAQGHVAVRNDRLRVFALD